MGLGKPERVDGENGRLSVGLRCVGDTLGKPAIWEGCLGSWGSFARIARTSQKIGCIEDLAGLTHTTGRAIFNGSKLLLGVQCCHWQKHNRSFWRSSAYRAVVLEAALQPCSSKTCDTFVALCGLVRSSKKLAADVSPKKAINKQLSAEKVRPNSLSKTTLLLCDKSPLFTWRWLGPWTAVKNASQYKTRRFFFLFLSIGGSLIL